MTDWIGVDMTTVTDEPMNVVYGLSCICHPEDGVRYVGQTIQGASVRLTCHRAMATHNKKHGKPIAWCQRWILKHGTQNIRATVLESLPDATDLNDRETFWIAKLRNDGAHLTNVGDGGDAVWRGGERPEHSERMRGSGNPMWGQDRSKIMAHARSFQVPGASLAKADHRGEKNSKARLTETDVISIRARWDAGGANLSAIAREYGITVQSVWAVAHRKTWKHVI